MPPAHIETTRSAIRQQPYLLPLAKREQVKNCVIEMPRDGVTWPSGSPWASPITSVPKKDGTIHFCVDYRKPNMVNQKGVHPLPHTCDVFDKLSGAASSHLGSLFCKLLASTHE